MFKLRMAIRRLAENPLDFFVIQFFESESDIHNQTLCFISTHSPDIDNCNLNFGSRSL